MNDENKRSVVKKCDKLADLFLKLSVEYKTLGLSLKRSKDKKEVRLIKDILKKKIKVLDVLFDEMKGGFE